MGSIFEAWVRPEMQVSAELRLLDGVPRTVPAVRVFSPEGRPIAVYSPTNEEVASRDAELLTHHIVSQGKEDLARADSLMKGVEEGLGPLAGKNAPASKKKSLSFYQQLTLFLGDAACLFGWIPILLFFLWAWNVLDNAAEASQEEALRTYVLAESREAAQYLKRWHSTNPEEPLSLGYHFMRTRPPVPNPTAYAVGSAWSTTVRDGKYINAQYFFARAPSGFGSDLFCSAPVAAGKPAAASDVYCGHGDGFSLHNKRVSSFVPGDRTTLAQYLKLKPDMTRRVEHRAQSLPYWTWLTQLGLVLMTIFGFCIPWMTEEESREAVSPYQKVARRFSASLQRLAKKWDAAATSSSATLSGTVRDLPLTVGKWVGWTPLEGEGPLVPVVCVQVQTPSKKLVRRFDSPPVLLEPEEAYQTGLELGRAAAAVVEQAHAEAQTVTALLSHAQSTALPSA